MRNRDFGILFVCAIGLLVSLQQEGALSIRRGFAVIIHDEASRARLLPPPIITDLDGNGKNEVVLLTARETLAVVDPRMMSRTHYDFTALDSSLEVPFFANCIGFATGYTKKPVKGHKDKKGKSEPRTQIIVAVTDDYEVHVFDHKLRQMWVDKIPGHDNMAITPDHASVIILPHDILKTDEGMIVVGVDTLSEEADDSDELPEGQHTHFSYFAFNAANGEVRWTHTATSFKDTETTSRPAHSYKLTPVNIQEMHSGEKEWTVFRKSVLHSLPHSHSHPHDTKFSLHHYSKKNTAKQNQNHAKQHKKDKTKHGGTSKRRHGSVVKNENYGELGDRLSGLTGIVRERLRQPHDPTDHIKHPNTIVARTAHGLEAIHLFTGRPLCQLGPLRAGHVYADVDGNTEVDSISAVVYKEDSGREVQGQCKGLITMGLPGNRGSTIWNGTICLQNGLSNHFEGLKNLLKQGEHHLDDNDDTSWDEFFEMDHNLQVAVPVVLRHRVHEVKGLTKLQSRVLFFMSSGLVTCVDVHQKRIVWQQDTDSIFRGHPMPSGGTESFSEEDGMSLKGVNHHEYHHRDYAHMVPFAVPAEHEQMAHGHGKKAQRAVAHSKDKPYVLIVGDSVLTAVRSSDGKIESELDLDEPVVAPLVLGDINSDGTMDFIAVGRGAYYGFITKQQGNASVVTFLILSVMGLLAMMFISQGFMNISDPFYDKGTMNKRSTD